MTRRDGFSDEIEPALAQALSSAPLPRARAGFEESLRERFVTGSFAAEPRLVESEPEDVRSSIGSLRRLGVGLAAAAGLAAFLMLGGGSTGRADWRLVRGEGTVRVGERTVSAGDHEGFAAALRSGRELLNEGDMLLLELGDLALVEVSPASRISLEPVGDAIELRTHEGGIRVSTGPGFPGRRLVVHTEHTRVEVVGTLFAVDITGNGTCVCCMEGRVVLPGDQEPCMAGAAMFADEGGPHAMDIPDYHRRQLEDFQTVSQAHWKR